MRYSALHPWNVTPSEAVRLQQALRDRLILAPPPGFAPRVVAGADMSMNRGDDRAWAAIVTLDAGTKEPLEQATSEVRLSFPYVPGLLSFRELPAVAACWERLQTRPDVLLFDGAGYAHPRRFGLACHGGVLFDVPSIGCSKTILVGEHGPLAPERGARSPLVHDGETVGMALRLRTGVKPVFVSVGHMMDLETAVEVVLHLGTGFREPETTRRAHRLVNAMRREAGPAVVTDWRNAGDPLDDPALA